MVTWQEKASASGSCDLCLCTQLLAHTLLYHNHDHHHIDLDHHVGLDHHHDDQDDNDNFLVDFYTSYAVDPSPPSPPIVLYICGSIQLQQLVIIIWPF